MIYDIGYICILVFDLILKINNYWIYIVLLKGEKNFINNWKILFEEINKIKNCI